jgi:chemotaxis protein MotB
MFGPFRDQEETVSHLQSMGRILPLLLIFLSGCVRSSTHEQTLTELSSSRAQHEEMVARFEAELERRDQREARLTSQTEELDGEISGLIDDLGEARRQTIQMGDQLTQSQLEADRLRNLLNAQGAEAQRLQGRLAQLSAIEQEIRERNRIYEEVLGRFESLIDAGRLSVSIIRGRLVINLPQDILFASGSASLGREGTQTLSEVASVLGEIEDRRFQVEGHTDDDPISTAQFPSNWELSAARALSVVKLLVDQGVAPEEISGAGYGEFHPVATNETREGKRLNRRIEIVMLPNLNVIADSRIGGEGGRPPA